MIDYCPYCGFKLNKIIKTEGITSCENCQRIFDTCKRKRMLSASWMCYRQHQQYAVCLKNRYDLEDIEVDFIQQYAIDKCLSHEEFTRQLDNSAISL